jgi:hypothetical protein
MNLKKAIYSLSILAGLLLYCLYPVKATSTDTLNYATVNEGNSNVARMLVPGAGDDTGSGGSGTENAGGIEDGKKQVLESTRERDLSGLTFGLLYRPGQFDLGAEWGGAANLRWLELKANYRLIHDGPWQVGPGVAWLKFNAKGSDGFKINHYVLGFDLSYQLSQRAMLAGSVGYGFDLPKVSLPISSSASGEEDGTIGTEPAKWQPDFWGYRLAFRYQIHYNWLFELGYRSYRYTDDGLGSSFNYDIDRIFNILTAGLIYRFGAPQVRETPKIAECDTVREVVPSPVKLTVTRITPDKGNNNETVRVEIVGSGFTSGVKVALTGPADVKIAGRDVVVVDPERLRCRFNLDRQPVGGYDLTVIGADGQPEVLVSCFTILDAHVTKVEPVAPAAAPLAANHDLRGLNQRLEPIYFDFDRATLRKDQVYKLETCLQLLRDNPELQLWITGHADARGKKAYNLKLSRRRAETVQRYLIEQGIAARRIGVAAYGSSWPAVEGSGEQVWRQNRRVELLIDELPPRF